jgi:molybdate transport system substrate-binding protein
MKVFSKILAGLALFLTVSAVQADEVLVAVSANFTGAARAIAVQFEQQTGHILKISYGSTGKLYAQIVNGAPFEVFLAADSKHPGKVETSGLAVPGSQFTYAKGRLVLWSADAGQFNDGEEYLRQMEYLRLAIANPKTAPYGLAAKQVLQHLALWDDIQKKVVRGDSIAQTFQFLVSGNAQAGFVAYSLVNQWRGQKGSLWIIPENYYQPIVQQAVLLNKGAENPAAQAFMAFLRSPKARAIISDFGYGIE